VREAGDWRTIIKTRTREDGTFAASADVDPESAFRLHSGDRAGAVLRGAR
nr:hypothetical protein [Solirubrobacterales bacterium]